MKDAPVERKIEEFHLKEIDKDKLYKFYEIWSLIDFLALSFLHTENLS